jgi:hypothetical protein
MGTESMPLFDAIEYTWHARRQMQARRISEADVDLVLRVGEGRPGRHGKWIFELGHVRVVVVEYEGSARIITVVRLRGQG